MKELFTLLVLLTLLPFSLYSQNDIKEFEGIIKYNHKIVAKESLYNVDYDYSGIGDHSEYYYRKGDNKFVNHDCYFKADLFKSKEIQNYFVLNNSDTVLVLDSRVADIEIIDFDVIKSIDTILGYSCDLLTLKLKPIDKEVPISYRRYYFSDQLPVNPSHFISCKANAYEFIFEKTKALPLKIEFEWPNKVIIWEAYDVVEQKLQNDIFKTQSNWVLTNINY